MEVIIKLKELREGKGFTQEQLARMLDIPLSTYRNIETGRVKTFNFEILFGLKRFLCLPCVDDLFDVKVNV